MGLSRIVRRAQIRRAERALYGAPESLAASPAGLIFDMVRWGAVGRYIWHSRRIQGWTRGREAVELAKAAQRLGPSPVIVEIGAFLGCATVLLAGACKLHGSGTVHVIDPFVPSGDDFSVPIYREIANSLPVSMRHQFEENLRCAGLHGFIAVHQGTAVEIGDGWRSAINLLFLDGDQSPEGARTAYLTWSRFLRRGGILVINNSADAPHEPGH